MNKFADKALTVVSDQTHIRKEALYVVWFAKTLQNWKALVSTDEVSGRYWEVTYNGDKKETYFDEYDKARNVCVPDEE